MGNAFDRIMDDPRYTAAVEDALAALAVAFHGRDAIEIVRDLAMTDAGKPCKYCGDSEHAAECVWARARGLLLKILEVGT